MVDEMNKGIFNVMALAKAMLGLGRHRDSGMIGAGDSQGQRMTGHFHSQKKRRLRARRQV
ncbi:hypothetical protein LCGC14_2944430 [marine sediment metagenome]|uniref:Uncharacterized protein n=1 Tax=marine sediment metagenome TaxID=412755 RepID=A0A0F8Y474_9ZZZZ